MVAVIRNIIDVIGEMKRKPRTGWVDHGIDNPETVWQHSVEMRSLSRNLAAKYLGASKSEICGRMGGVHDIIEGIVPDITPHMGIATEQKKELEFMAIDFIGQLPHGARIRDTWVAFENRESTEAHFVHKVDKLHVAITALRYEQQDRCRYSLQPFWDSVRKHVCDTPLIEDYNALLKQRPTFAHEKPVLVRTPLPPNSFENMRRVVMYKIGRGNEL